MRAKNTLFGEAVRKRPGRYDEATMALAVDLLLHRLRDSGLDGLRELEDSEQVREDLEDALRASWAEDGYEMGRCLEHSGWTVDAQLVEILDGGALDDATRQRVAEWVESEGIEPALTLGAAVTYEGHPATIVRIDAKVAQYTVNVPAMEHVRPGDLGTCGVIVPFEMLEAT